MAVFEGLNVLELGAGAAGPVVTRYLADHGATVVRVESTRRPDFLRLLTPDKFGINASPMYVQMNPNKLSVSINMSKPEGVEVVKRLVGWADVVSENFSPKAMAKWGLDYETLRAIKPDLIMISSCLFGQTGPQRMYPGFGGQGSAISGFNHLTGWPDREPVGPYGTITDSLSPRYAAFLVVAALMHRERAGEGQYIDASQIETGVYSLSESVVRYSANGELAERRGNRAEHAAPHGCFPCRGEDRWIAIAVMDDGQWLALRALMGDPEWADDAFAEATGRLARVDELEAHVAAWTADQEPHGLMTRLREAGVPAGVVQTMEDVNADPQLAHRGHFVELEHRHLGRMRYENYGIRLEDSPPQIRTATADLGENNAAVLGGMLGFGQDEIAEMIERDIIV